MKLLKFIKFMSFVTVVTIIYIYMQMQIFDLAYRGKKKEKQIIGLSEENGMVAYNILQLKSASHLGFNLLETASGLQFRDQKDVMKLVATTGSERTVKEDEPIVKTGKVNAFLSFISERFTRDAQAEEKKAGPRPWQSARKMSW